MKLCLVKKVALVGILVLGLTPNVQAEEFTRAQALQVMSVLMQAKTVTNTYGGRYSQTTHDLQKIELYKKGGKFEIMLQSHAPSINIDEIIVDGVPLRNLLN